MCERGLDLISEYLFKNPDNFLEGLWDFREALYPQWADFAEAFVGSTDVKERFCLALIDNLERTKRANMERVVVKTSELDRVGQDLRDILGQFLNKYDERLVESLGDVFHRLRFDELGATGSVRIPIWGRAYSIQSPDMDKPELVTACTNEDETIIVSKGRCRSSYVHFDLWLSCDGNEEWGTEAYLQKFGEFANGASPCFIKKYAGVKGPIQLRDEFSKMYHGRVLTYSQVTGRVRPPKVSGGQNEKVCILAGDVLTRESLLKVESALVRQGFQVTNAVVFCMEDDGLSHDLPMEVASIYSGALPDDSRTPLKTGPIYNKQEVTGDLPIEIEHALRPEIQQRDEEVLHDMKWYREHEEEILSEYRGMWVGIANGQIVTGKSVDELGRESHKRQLRIGYVRYLQADGEL